MMTPEEKTRSITYIVDKVFLPQIGIKMQTFLEDYKKAIITCKDMSSTLKVPINMETPTVLDIRPEVEALIKNLLALDKI